MRLDFLLLFLCLPLLAGQELTAQYNKDSLQKLADRYYKLAGLKMSDDGRWLTIRKSYDRNSDTVLIFSSWNAEQPAGYRTKVRNLVFLSNDNLLMQSPHKAELLNLKEQTSKYFYDIKQIEAFGSNIQFLLHYDEKEKNRLELRDCNGNLLVAANNVSRFFTTDSGNIYAIAENEKNENEVYSLKNELIQKIYSTTNKIASLDVCSGKNGILVYEQIINSDLQEVMYIDLTTKDCFPLKEALSVFAQNGFGEAIHEGYSYFLRLWVNKEKADTSLVDIWYGNDNKLEEKFTTPARELYFVWEPKGKKVWQIGNDSFTANINIGSNQYFISFDPCHFQDYTTGSAPLQIYVYDRVKDRYSVLGIAHEMCFSGNGEYALSPENRDWYLYHIPSGNRKLIPGKGLGKPWFTDDGEAVLFEGEGALWKYDLKSDVLAEVTVFEGYQTSIVNGDWKGISTTSGRFSKQNVNFTEPLVIRLYDPQENLTSYVLWRKGKSDVIVPPTYSNVQFLNYSRSYDCFSWVEENYNIPPLMVFKKELEAGKILYQSNNPDKSILSLKQEIVTYSGSEEIPLKGILYYPLNYNPSVKYPMVVHIYKVQSNKEANKYPVVLYNGANNDGFNLRLLLENGYFVYFPDIVYGAKGPGISALDCVNHALDALENNTSINKNRIGLIGHSHGGYETNFIATHSGRFAAYVSGAGNSDIVRSYFSFNYNFSSPFYWQYEDGQYEMKKSFSEDKNLYFRNNPIHYADQVSAPVLLWTGMKDQNIYWEQTMEFYTGLKRNNKKVVALFYTREPHAFNTPDACRDLVSRILTWFNYFLKGEEDVGWIDKEIKEDAR